MIGNGPGIEVGEVCALLDLPEFVMESILERLDPAGLLNMSWTCRLLRSKCRGDHLWEMQLRKKWGDVIGFREADRSQWQGYVGYMRWRGMKLGELFPMLKSVTFPTGIDFLSWLPKHDSPGEVSQEAFVSPDDSAMCWFLALEYGRIWFPAQVYNRENASPLFMMSCYDAAVIYDRQTDTFTARYPPHDRETVADSTETGITWTRIRAPFFDITPHDLHLSDCLDDLCPGDHIEIQWRFNREFPYGWWYGIVGHLHSCHRVNEKYCLCHESDTIVLEFKQYSVSSWWRRAVINRRNLTEQGDDDYGLYGGLRKLCTVKEISTWNMFQPSELLE